MERNITFMSKGFIWSLNADTNELKHLSFNKSFNGILIIPSEIERIKIKSIANDVFKNKKLTKVIITEGIININDYAFHNCGILQLYLPQSIKHIGKEAFTKNNIQNTNIFIHSKDYEKYLSSFDENVQQYYKKLLL